MTGTYAGITNSVSFRAIHGGWLSAGRSCLLTLTWQIIIIIASQSVVAACVPGAARWQPCNICDCCYRRHKRETTSMYAKHKSSRLAKEPQRRRIQSGCFRAKWQTQYASKTLTIIYHSQNSTMPWPLSLRPRHN